MAAPKAVVTSQTLMQPTFKPNQTLYITNLPSTKLTKQDMRRDLAKTFSNFGHVLDVVALRTQRMRGQAHIVFRSANKAAQAMRQLQGHRFYGREMVISYAKSKSNVVSRLDGSAKNAFETPAPQSFTQQQHQAADGNRKTVFGSTAPTQHPLPPPPRADGELFTNGTAQEEGPKGMKRGREEFEEEKVATSEKKDTGVDEGDAPMEEDDDEGSAMEESDDDD